MNYLSTLTIAFVMAFAFSGPAVFTSSPANAGDWYCFNSMGIESEEEKHC
ncbi:MAG: hypothetical protein V6Z81_11295 [Parvularculales bacterium]